MLPLSSYRSPFQPYRAFNSPSSSPGTFRSPFRHPSRFPPSSFAGTELENILLHRQFAHLHHDVPRNYPFHRSVASPFNSQSPCQLNHEERYTFPTDRMRFRLRVVIASYDSYCIHGGNFRERESFNVTIPVSASIEDVYENLVGEMERGGRHVSIRVYFVDGGWEPLVGFRDVVELRRERGVEGLVVVEQC